MEELGGEVTVSPSKGNKSMTTTNAPGLTPALAEELKAALKDETIRFPYECSDDALAFIEELASTDENKNTWLEMRARYELMIRKHGRAMVTVPKEIVNGELMHHAQTGKVMMDFVYTLGQGRKGLPEIICFYGSDTVCHAINHLCDKLEAGEVELDEDGVAKVTGCFSGGDHLAFLLMPLTGNPRKLAAEKYACQCEDDEPLFLAIAPLPDGSYRQEFIPEGLR